MVAMASYYSIDKAIATPAPPPAVSSDLATSMAVYRQTVLDYLRKNPNFQNTSISDSDMRTELPSWYVVPQGRQLNLPWAHCICPDGTVVVYAKKSIPVSITKDLLKLSKNSVNVGESLGGTSVYSPVLDAKGMQSLASKENAGAKNTAANSISVPGCSSMPSVASIAAGSPVWVAKLK